MYFKFFTAHVDTGLIDQLVALMETVLSGISKLGALLKSSATKSVMLP